MLMAHSAARGGPGADAGFWNGMKRDAAGRTQEAGDSRKQKIADYLMKQKIGSEGVAEIDQIRNSDQQAAMLDPNSGVSRATRAGFKRMFADEVQNFPELEQMNARDIQGLMKNYEVQAKMSIDRSMKDAQAQALLANEDNKEKELNLRRDQMESTKGKTQAEIEYLKARAKQVPIQAAGKQSVETNSGYELSPKDELKNYSDLQKDMISARSKPELAQALRDRPAVLKAKQMIEQFRGNYDKMTKNEVALLDSEIAKIATGGVPHESFMKELDPKTAQSMVENFKQKWTNIPQGAQLGDFVERRLKYLDDLDKVTNKIISDYGVKAYMTHEQGISPEHRQQIQQNYPEIFSPYVVPTAKNDKAPDQETKTLNGKEYVKVNGGWKAK